MASLTGRPWPASRSAACRELGRGGRRRGAEGAGAHVDVGRLEGAHGRVGRGGGRRRGGEGERGEGRGARDPRGARPHGQAGAGWPGGGIARPMARRARSATPRPGTSPPRPMRISAT